MLKVLYYNWTDYRSPRGGGVTVYLRNLLAAMADAQEIAPVFLSSGEVYSPFSSRPYIRPVKNTDNQACPAFELVNSPVPAPASQLVQNLHNYLNLSDTAVLDLLRKFIAEQGGFDVIHFHNLEGLPLNVLKIKEYFPEIKIVFSLHNYFPFCPNVQLFQHRNSCSCHSFRGGLECGCCRSKELKADWFVEPLSRWFAPGSLWSRFFKPWHYIKSRLLSRKLLSVGSQSNSPQTYKDFRRLNISFLNRYADKVLAVSKRVSKIAEEFGIAAGLLEVAYIGSDYAGIVPFPKPRISASVTGFTLVYLGYARAAKGFFFLLSALKQLPENVASGINLRLAARYIDEALNPASLDDLRRRFRSVEISDGYRREDLPCLLADVDLGIVPVIWEDNLPQVAIEMSAHGVPVLASDYGGASELSSSPYFHFRGGDSKDFIARLHYLVKNPEVLADYHRFRLPLTSMPEHLQQLQKIYAAVSEPELRAVS